MIYTNIHNLPESVYKLLAKDRYNGSSSTDYSVTTLLQPPRITQLSRRYASILTEDIMSNLWSLFGQVAHSLLEEHGAENALNEERIHVTMLERVVSGQVDSYSDGIITDYKVTSAWTLVYGSRIKEWEEQLNLYSFLFQSEGYSVRQLRICAILRDWDKNKAKQNKDYPQTPIVIIPLTLWNKDKTEEYLIDRLSLHKDAEELTDEDLPLCSKEDMWEQQTKYAVMSSKRKTAVKLFDDKEEAEAFIFLAKDASQYLQTRCGKRTRCQDYCSVNKFCNSYQDYLKEQES